MTSRAAKPPSTRIWTIESHSELIPGFGAPTGPCSPYESSEVVSYWREESRFGYQSFNLLALYSTTAYASHNNVVLCQSRNLAYTHHSAILNITVLAHTIHDPVYAF